MEYLSEACVLERYDMFDAAELRRARNKGQLAYFAFRSGIRYREADVEDYIDRVYRRGPEPAAAAAPAAAAPVPAPEEPPPVAPPPPEKRKSARHGAEAEQMAAEAAAKAILGRRGSR